MSSRQPFNSINLPNNEPLLASRSSSIDSLADLGSDAEVQHIQHLSDHIGSLFGSDEYSDLTLIVEGQSISAHKVILAARSEYFRALLYGGLKESSLSEIELKDTPLDAFRILLRYIYTGQMNLAPMKDELVIDILSLANQYSFQELENAVSQHLKTILTLDNVCLIYDTSALFHLSDLLTACGAFLDNNASEILNHKSFSTLTSGSLRSILSRDSFCASEVNIFIAVHEWTVKNPHEDASEVISAVRLNLMYTHDLLKVVRPTGLIPPNQILDAIQSRTESRDMELKYRGYLIPEENIALSKFGAQVINGEVKQALLNGDSKNYDMERGFSRHQINEKRDHCIIIKLGNQYIINHLKMLLWDKDSRAYSYFIELSMDQKDWIRVIDYSQYYCRSWQYLYFQPKVARYIRIVGTHNTVNKIFHVVALEAYYTKINVPKIDRSGLIIPETNVAKVDLSSTVIEGVSRLRNALLNGETSDYDWDSGYTCHQLGSGAIVVQLGQPYILSSMRLLLWDCDDRSYSYYIEVSVNLSEWEVIWDRSRVPCKSWQLITFPQRPVVYIRIVGTHNTANEVFHCVHFECPSTNNSIQECSEKKSENIEASKSSPMSTRANSDASSIAGSSRFGGGDQGAAALSVTAEDGDPMDRLRNRSFNANANPGPSNYFRLTNEAARNNYHPFREERPLLDFNQENNANSSQEVFSGGGLRFENGIRRLSLEPRQMDFRIPPNINNANQDRLSFENESEQGINDDFPPILNDDDSSTN